MARTWGSWLDLGNKNNCHGKKPITDKGAADHQDRKAPLIVMILALLTVASAIAFMALFDWIAE
jgi:hypothetical protein